MAQFWTYILRCSDGSSYVGHTDDLEVRVVQHNIGTFPGYTKDRRPIELVHYEEWGSRHEAFARERQLKGWSRAKEEALIAGDRQGLRRNARQSKERPD